MEPQEEIRAPVEYPTTLYLGGEELVTIQTTPVDLEDFAVGYLFTEGWIRSLDEVVRVTVYEEKALIWVELREGRTGPVRGLVAGSERGVVPPVEGLVPPPPGPAVGIRDLAAWMREMGLLTPLYRQTGGMHSAMAVRVATGERLVREDVGRHNAVDKVIGAALRRGWTGSELVILTSGRISYEMCVKLARFGVGLAASRTAATDMAVDLAERLGMDLVGYLRTEQDYRLYTVGRRLSP
ncbi:MAG: formate dehydrogenase accessory sulfurtransferase FdhD [Firmicutes bacterium]|nr:formate dehydrogenase accessory sulfurtransferase FdhD [Bacillota bacterium]